MARRPIITVKLNRDRAAEAEFARRVNDAQRLVAKKITQNTADFVRDVIPRLGGWYDIYRDAIKYYATSDGVLFAASGYYPRKTGDYPADTTLIFFERRERDNVSAVLHARNPWTIDKLPSLLGGIQLDAKARPAAEAEVKAQRQRLIDAESEIKEQITSAGGRFSDELPEIKGKVYADVNFMAIALERGLAGLRRVPHWTSALRRVQQDAGSMIAPITGQLQSVMDGETRHVDIGETMPPDLERVMDYRPNRRVT